MSGTSQSEKEKKSRRRFLVRIIFFSTLCSSIFKYRIIDLGRILKCDIKGQIYLLYFTAHFWKCLLERGFVELPHSWFWMLLFFSPVNYLERKMTFWVSRFSYSPKQYVSSKMRQVTSKMRWKRFNSTKPALIFHTETETQIFHTAVTLSHFCQVNALR